MKKLLSLLLCGSVVLASASVETHIATAQPTASKQLISTKNVGPFRYILSQEQDAYRLRIQLPAQLPSAEKVPEIFTLENPARVVIDVPIVGKLLTRDDALPSSMFSRVRIGEHPGKTRIVLDVRGATPPFHLMRRSDSTSEYSAELFFPYRKEAQTAPQAVAKPNPPQSQKTPKYTKRTIRVRNVKTATLRKRSRSPLLARARMRPPRAVYRQKRKGGFRNRMVPGGVAVKVSEHFRKSFSDDREMQKAIRYRSGKDGSLTAIQIVLDRVDGHTFTKADTNEYVLRLTNVKEAEMRIFVQPGMQLESSTDSSGLTLKVLER